MVSNICSEAPVVRAVLEEVEQWHGAVREPVHELGFQKALSIMEGPATCSNAVKKFVPSASRNNERK